MSIFIFLFCYLEESYSYPCYSPLDFSHWGKPQSWQNYLNGHQQRGAEGQKVFTFSC